MRVVGEIYARSELELTRETETRMQGWIADQPASARSAHHYEQEVFGLSAASTRREFAAYMARYRL